LTFIAMTRSVTVQNKKLNSKDPIKRSFNYKIAAVISPNVLTKLK
jgi:hypothetical protein